MTQGPEPAQIVRAWCLATGRDYNDEPHPTGRAMSSYQVARQMGISQPTASRYIRTGRESEGWIDLLDHAGSRLAQATRLDKYLRWIDEEAARRDQRARDEAKDPTATADKTDLIPLAIKVEDRWASLAGLDEPKRIRNENSTTPRQPPPDVVAAIQATQAQSARELAEIDAAQVIDQEPEGDDPR